MKKNNKTYVLLAVVIGVWGSIGFKFLSAVNPSQKKEVQIATNEIFVPKQAMERDTFSIVANYRDPFLGTVQATKKVRKSAPKKAKEQTPEKSISYTGFITDKTSKRQMFFVTVEGRQQMMTVNDIFQDVKLIRGAKDKIKVRYNGKTRTISLTE